MSQKRIEANRKLKVMCISLSEEDIARFWSHVIIPKDENNNPDVNACWIWDSNEARNKNRYGRFKVNNVKYNAHRISYLLHYKCFPIEGMHTCDNPPCVNYHHIVSGTHKENMQDKLKKGRGNNKLVSYRKQARNAVESDLCIFLQGMNYELAELIRAKELYLQGAVFSEIMNVLKDERKCR